MWPWAHAALGYLCYTVYLRARHRGHPDGWPVVALGVGTQLPDLVDKTLAWYGHILPYGRTLTHSLLVVLPLSLLVYRYTKRRNAAPIGVGFAVGYGSHLLGDALHPLLTREWADLGFLLWPITPVPAAGEVEGILNHLRDIEGQPFFLFGLLLTASMLVLWNHHGRPGLANLVGVVSRRVP